MPAAHFDILIGSQFGYLRIEEFTD
jgi:hypothetical protein